jgi:hypothetical protein
MGDAPVYRHVEAGSPPEATEHQRYPHRRRIEFELLAADLSPDPPIRWVGGSDPDGWGDDELLGRW